MVNIQLNLSDKANAIVTYTKTKNKLNSKEDAINFLLESQGMIE